MTKEIWLEIKLDVEVDITGASRGARDKYGAPLEPDEEESFEVTSVKYNGQELKLTGIDAGSVDDAVAEEIERDADDVDFD
jgi:hypothetical protein